MADTERRPAKDIGFTSETLALGAFLARRPSGARQIERDDMRYEARWDVDGVWFVVTRAGKGGFALRGAFGRGPFDIHAGAERSDGFDLRVTNAEGVYEIAFSILENNLVQLRATLTPDHDLLIPFWPRDLYPLDAVLNPIGAKGWVEAAQRGVNTGLCYICLSKPDFGAALYVQDLTSLNAYFDHTHSKPDGVVGGRWPELGYQPPTAPLGNSPPEHVLPAAKRVVVSDAYLTWDGDCLESEHKSASTFLELLGRIYPRLTKPKRRIHDWRARAEKSLVSLYDRAVRLSYEGADFLHPYVEAEYPDCMVQATVAAAIAEYEVKFSKGGGHAAALVAGMDKFFDPSLKTLRRYLPKVGGDKNRREVDSWYLYHPLMNLARLAGHGHEKARALFLQSLDYSIRAARHFEYKWPITFDVVDFSILKATRDDDGHGQTDVAGLYAFVMLLAESLTGESWYRDEARKALRAATGLRFELCYQTNLTAWGALACAKLGADGDEEFFRAQALVYIANFLHNCEMWDSEIECAKNFSNFLGATCLHDGPYMAAFECFDSFAAFEEMLRTCRDQIPDHVAVMLTDYCAYALDRAWFYYPDAIPEDMLSEKVRNGRIDRSLSLPLEDLYGDGQKAGQVGQEVYGAGSAFTFASRMHHFGEIGTS